MDRQGAGIISDRDKGLINAIQNEFQNLRHLYCAKHLERNIVGRKIIDFHRYIILISIIFLIFF